MPAYYYFDCIVDSDIDLPELSGAAQDTTGHQRICVEQSAVSLSLEDATDWYDNDANTEGEIGIAYGRLSGQYFMRFADIADFSIDVEGRKVLGNAHPGCDAATLRHLLLDQVLPRLLGQQGEIVLHASMAEMGDDAVAFVGRSGWGKSTLAASLSNSGTCGDDALLVASGEKEIECTPAYRGARLWDDSIAAVYKNLPPSQSVSHYSSKQRVLEPNAQRKQAATRPLRALFILNDPWENPTSDIQISSLTGSEPLMAILQRCFLLDPHDMVVSRQLWSSLGNVLRAGLPVYQLSYPRKLGDLPALRTRILAHLSDSS